MFFSKGCGSLIDRNSLCYLVLQFIHDITAYKLRLNDLILKGYVCVKKSFYIFVGKRRA